MLPGLALVSDIVHDDSEELVTMAPTQADTFPPDTDGRRSVSPDHQSHTEPAKNAVCNHFVNLNATA